MPVRNTDGGNDDNVGSPGSYGNFMVDESNGNIFPFKTMTHDPHCPSHVYFSSFSSRTEAVQKISVGGVSVRSIKFLSCASESRSASASDGS